MADDHGERLASLEARLDGMEAVVLRETKGYVDGQIRSVLENQRASFAELSREIEALRMTVHGVNGDNGMRSGLWRLKWTVKIQWLAILVLCWLAYGLKLPLIP